jgi:hypothetical protein
MPSEYIIGRERTTGRLSWRLSERAARTNRDETAARTNSDKKEPRRKGGTNVLDERAARTNLDVKGRCGRTALSLDAGSG